MFYKLLLATMFYHSKIKVTNRHNKQINNINKLKVQNSQKKMTVHWSLIIKNEKSKK